MSKRYSIVHLVSLICAILLVGCAIMKPEPEIIPPPDVHSILATLKMRYDLVVNTFTRDAYDRRRLAIHAGGRMWRPMLHIDDAVDSYMSVLEAPSEMVSGRVFNVLSENLQVIKIAYETRRALETYKGIRLDLEVQQVGVVRSYRVDGSRFQELFDTIGRRDLGSAVSEMWDHLEGGIDVTDPVYYNIRWLELLCDIKQRLKTMGGSPL